MVAPTGNYTLVRGTGFIQRLWYLYHRLGIWSNILVAAGYGNANDEELTKPALLAALRVVVEAHPALWQVFVQRPSANKGCHSLETGALRTINLEECIELWNDSDGTAITSNDLERLHNEWLWDADEPERPLWKLVMKGRNIVFVYHHSLGDGMSGTVFHREFLAALNSASANKAGVGGSSDNTIAYTHEAARIPLEPEDVWQGRPSILEMIWTQIVCWYMKLWYGNSRIYGDLPPSKPHLTSLTAHARPEDRTITCISSHRIPATKMSQILQACRKNETTFTPLLISMTLIVLATEFYPDAKIGASRYAFDLRPYLSMSQIGGGTSSGTFLNATGSGEEWHKLEPIRRAVIEESNGTGFSLKPEAVWDLVKRYKETMTSAITGKAVRSWIGTKLMGRDLETVVSQAFPSVGLLLKPTFSVSNLGAFSEHLAGDANGSMGPWRIEDVQFSAAAVNGNQGTHGAIFHVAGIKGGDTVINATYEDGIVERAMAERIMDRVVARIYEII